MKKARYLTRDYRMVEPKKPGQPKACLRFVTAVLAVVKLPFQTHTYDVTYAYH